MSSDFAVKVVKIKEVVNHPKADRLSLATINDWQCVIQRDAYKSGDLAIYIPIDSILTPDLEAKLFGPDAKIKLNKSRVRTIKIRGSISQGMLASCQELNIPLKEGYDCTKDLGITKFEPPVNMSVRGGDPVSKKNKNPHFKEYGGLDNFKNYPDLFKDGEEVVITEKIHGTNFRFGWVPMNADTLWKRVKKWFGYLPEYEFVFGSNRVQLQGKKYKGYYEQKGAGNVYEEAVEKYRLKELTNIPQLRGCVFYGEIYGSSVQKNYMYGCKEGERKLVIFDIMLASPGNRTGDALQDFESGYVNFNVVNSVCAMVNLPVVPILYSGPYNAAQAKALTVGNSVLEPTQRVREGVVIKPTTETKCRIGRKVLKLISDDYLLNDDNTDFH